MVIPWWPHESPMRPHWLQEGRVLLPATNFPPGGGVYYKWGYVMPLALQILMTPCQLYESPLFQMHVMGKAQKRPFPTSNPFGLPSAPTPEAESVEDSSDSTGESRKDK